MEQLRSEALATAEYNQERRLYDDTTTWLAEMLEGQMRTPFEYHFDGRELYGQDGSALGKIFQDSLEAAKDFSPELSFEARRRRLELDEYHEMINMMQGSKHNTIIVVSDFPAELATSPKDIGGYNVARQQTMLRVLRRTDQGTLIMQSQTLDKSDRDGLEALYKNFGINTAPGELLGQRMHLSLDSESQEFLIDSLVGVYDRTLASKFGGAWYAGRNQDPQMNTYDFVRSQTDLIGMYTETAQKFGDNPSFLYDIAAALQKRFEALSKPTAYHQDSIATPDYIAGGLFRDQLIDEVITAGKEARQLGKTQSGCGLTLGDEELTPNDQLSELGYGNISQEDKFGSLTFKCQKGHTNTRPRNKLIPRCKTCGVSVKC